jgi:GalNAc5-diNAcBac-PP-undecaprenol beta-1,3-glucosyltransferase
MIVRTLDSVLKQEFRDYEVVVVDDGSTDNTRYTIMVINDTRVKYHYKKNGERGAARNFGIRQAVGKYLVFLDSDDLMLPGHLQALYDHLSVSDEFFIATKYDFMDETGKTFSSTISAINPGSYDHRFFLNGNPLACNICIRRDNPQLITFREERELSGMEDWIFLLENTFNHPLELLDVKTIRMNDHQQRSMRSDHESIIRARLKATNYLIESMNIQDSEKNVLIGYSNYFCAVHGYLGNLRKVGFLHLKEAIRYSGIKLAFVILAIKIFIGKEWISRITGKG